MRIGRKSRESRAAPGVSFYARRTSSSNPELERNRSQGSFEILAVATGHTVIQRLPLSCYAFNRKSEVGSRKSEVGSPKKLIQR